MFSLSIKIGPLLHEDTHLWQRVMLEFEKKAGDRIVEAVQHHLGSADIYTLTERYSDRKKAGRTKPRMKRFPGKAADQPLILTGAMLEALGYRIEGDMLVVQVMPTGGYSKNGEDYAEKWEEAAHYLEAGFDDVKDGLAELLGEIIMQEMKL